MSNHSESFETNLLHHFKTNHQMKNSTTNCNSRFTFSRITSFAVILFLIIFSIVSKANHVTGGYITYSYASGTTYNIKLSLFRDCDGIPLGNFASVSVAGPGLSTNRTLTRISIIDRTVLCPGQSSDCTVPSSTVEGMQEHIYSGTVTIPVGIGNYQIVYEECCRANNVSNLVPVGGIYLSALLRHNATLNNSSPVFLNPSIRKFCIGQLASYSLNAFDAEGDQLVYSLVPVRSFGGSLASYAGGFSFSQPITGSPVVLNSSNGLLTFTPSVANQRDAIRVRVEELRGGIVIGETFFDVEITTGVCTNNTPIFTSVANQTAQVGQQICIPITINDVDGDLVSLNAVSGLLPIGSFVINSTVNGTTQAMFCYTPTAADEGHTYAVTINANDNSCPEPGSATLTFNISVPSPFVVPTISEWGLIILALISLSLGMVFIYKRQQQVAA
ncbi:MAG: hypothetical protein IPI46_13045 [Bacteroidetes bacterium]|nr:hypothetical protein [Bacteroidota bacterium]